MTGEVTALVPPPIRRAPAACVLSRHRRVRGSDGIARTGKPDRALIEVMMAVARTPPSYTVPQSRPGYRTSRRSAITPPVPSVFAVIPAVHAVQCCRQRGREAELTPLSRRDRVRAETSAPAPGCARQRRASKIAFTGWLHRRRVMVAAEAIADWRQGRDDVRRRRRPEKAVWRASSTLRPGVYPETSTSSTRRSRRELKAATMAILGAIDALSRDRHDH